MVEEEEDAAAGKLLRNIKVRDQNVTIRSGANAFLDFR